MLLSVLPTNGKRFVPPRERGQLLGPRSLRKGEMLMVTYSDLIQLGILIVGIIALFFQINEKKK